MACSLRTGKDPKTIDNPAYSIPRTSSNYKRADLSRIVMQTENSNMEQDEEEEQQKTGGSSKWDHHITLALIITVVSALLLNPISFAFGICGIVFAYKVNSHTHTQAQVNECLIAIYFRHGKLQGKISTS